MALAISAKEINVPLMLAAADTRMLSKGSVDKLHSEVIPRLQRGKRITSLTFDTLPGRNIYADFAIHEYLNVLRAKDSFRYVVFMENGSYRGWMPAVRFYEMFQQQGSIVTQWINQGNFDRFRQAGMHTEQISSTATALEALDLLTRSGEEGLGVLTPDGVLVGIASLQGIQSTILAKVLARPPV